MFAQNGHPVPRRNPLTGASPSRPAGIRVPRRSLVRLLTVGTAAANESLRDHGAHRRGDQERLDPHVHQPVQPRDRFGGVQRGEHHVAGQGGLDRDPGGVDVTDLPDQDHVGSCRRMERRPPAKVIPACSLIWIWLIESSRYSTGSSIVMMLRSVVLSSPSEA